MAENKAKEVVVAAEEVVVEVVKAPFKITAKLFNWAFSWMD